MRTLLKLVDNEFDYDRVMREEDERRNRFIVAVFLGSVVAVVAFFLWAGKTYGETPAFLEDALKRNVYVTNNLGQGSGVVYSCMGNRAKIITNFHNLLAFSKTGADGYEAKVVKVDPERDLALLEAEHPCDELVMPFQFDDAELLDEVWCVSNPANIRNVVSPGRVIGFHEDMLVLDILTTGGSSGGGVWNAEGKFVGLHNGAVNSNPPHAWIPLAIPAKHVKNFVK